MGSALLFTWQQKELGEITVVDPVMNKLGVTHVESLEKLSADYFPDVIVLAIKPQNFDEILPQLSKFSGALFVSIAAGKTISSIQKFIPEARGY